MPSPENIKELLLKYIAGEADSAECALVEEWLSEDPAHFKEFEQLWDLWYAVGTATNVFRFNTDSGWEAVLQKVQHQEQKKNRFPFRRMAWVGVRAAAAVLLLMVAYVWWQRAYQFAPQQETGLARSPLVKHPSLKKTFQPAYDFSLQTKAGEQVQVKLPDSSLVWLNGNTSIHFSDNPDSKERVINLRGEAFFDVKHYDGKPFIVKTTHASIKVLGTRFDVTAYPEDSITEAVLTRGSILFSAEIENKKVVHHMVPGQKIIVNHLSDQLEVRRVDTAFYAGWKEGKLLFRNETFEQVARAMERKYNVSFEFKNKGLLEKQLNGYLEKESLQQALEALRLTLQFRYEMNDRQVIIY